MSENPQGPSLEEVMEALKNYQRKQWRFIVSFIFGPIGDDKTYRANDLRDRLWIMWCMARIAANEQFFDELDAAVEELYNERKDVKWVVRKGPEYPVPHLVVQKDNSNEPKKDPKWSFAFRK